MSAHDSPRAVRCKRCSRPTPGLACYAALSAPGRYCRSCLEIVDEGYKVPTKQGAAQEAILRMVREGIVPTPDKINAAIGQTWRKNQINGRLTKFRAEAMLQAGFFRVHHVDSHNVRWMPPGAVIPEGWTRDAD